MSTQQNVFETLQERGYVEQVSSEHKVRALLNTPGATIYEGFDPTAPSLTLGHLMSLTLLHHLQEAGHRVIFILGGGTGKIGDPSGKQTSRKLLTPEEVAANGIAIRQQVEGMGFLRFSGPNAALMLDNNDWLGKFLFLDDFMLKIARHFSVNVMIKWRTFAERLAAEENLSLMELGYAAMQSWDFLYLFEEYDCRLQVGGRDQWQNILVGIDLIRAKTGGQAFALTTPLLETPSGQKMGKTEAGTIWLDPGQTSPFDFYQYLVNTPDEMVEQVFKLLTFLPLDEIEEIVAGDPRKAQERLAFEVTSIVHGKKETQKAQEASRAAFEGVEASLESMPTFAVPPEGMSLLVILTKSGALPSKSEVRRRADGGAISLDGQRLSGREETATIVKPPAVIKYGKSAFLRVTTK